jgi:hypothetical protein
MPHEAVRALEPAIRDMFLQAVRADDSYVFSNAVLGLAALANSFGADVLRALAHVYADSLQGVHAGVITRRDVDVHLRVGEAPWEGHSAAQTLPPYIVSTVFTLFYVIDRNAYSYFWF